VKSYQTIRDEILRYDPMMLEKPSVLALTKCDLLPEGKVDPSLLALHGTTIRISSVSTMGLKALKAALQRILFQ
jgi:GTPase involved in cell partitioning and DNA repair